MVKPGPTVPTSCGTSDGVDGALAASTSAGAATSAAIRAQPPLGRRVIHSATAIYSATFAKEFELVDEYRARPARERTDSTLVSISVLPWLE
jgi:hypothetical protein